MIYICIPSYDEAPTIGVLLWKVRQVMAEFQRDYKILVLDDGSTDRTQEVLEPYLRVMPLTVIRHSHRQGYARATERLIREAVRRAPYPKRDCVVTLQADFTDDPESIPEVVKRIEGGIDLVSARAARASAEEGGRGPRWARRAVVFLARRFGRLPEEVRDPLTGLRAYRVICLRKLFEEHGRDPLLRGDGWTVNAELLAAVAPHARRIEEIEVPGGTGARRRPSRLEPWPAVKDFVAFLRHPPQARPAPPHGSVDVEEMEARSLIERYEAGEKITLPRQEHAEAARKADRRRSRGGGRARSSGRKRRGRSGPNGDGKQGDGGASGSAGSSGVAADRASGSEDGSTQGSGRRRRKRGGRRRRGGRRGSGGSGGTDASGGSGAESQGDAAGPTPGGESSKE